MGEASKKIDSKQVTALLDLWAVVDAARAAAHQRTAPVAENAPELHDALLEVNRAIANLVTELCTLRRS